MKQTLSFLLFLCLVSCSSMGKRRVSGEETSITFPSNINKAKELLLFGNWATTSTLTEFVRVVDEINQQSEPSDRFKLRIFSDLTTDFNSGETPQPGDVINEMGIADLGFSYSARDLPDADKFIVFYIDSDTKMAPDLWLQDYGQLYFTGETPTFLDLNYATLATSSELFRYIRSPRGLNGQIDEGFQGKRTQETINSTLEGGDLEVLPNGTILVGDVMHPDLVSYLENDLGQKVLQVPAGFMATGHVDEVFSIVPAPKDQSNGCGYALAHIDPLYGLRLALDRDLKHTQTDNRSEFIAALAYFTETDGEEAIHRDHFAQLPSRFKKEKHIQVTQEQWGTEVNGPQWYVYKTVDIHQKVQQGIVKIKEELQGSCADLKTVGLPVIFSDYAAGESTLFTADMEKAAGDRQKSSDAAKQAPVNLHFSPVNMVVLNEHLFMPSIQDMSPSFWNAEFSKSFEETYQWIIPLRLKKVGIEESKSHFINANVYVYNGGSLHCGSLVARDRAETVY